MMTRDLNRFLRAIAGSDLFHNIAFPNYTRARQGRAIARIRTVITDMMLAEAVYRL
jgi:hypothetical protein